METIPTKPDKYDEAIDYIKTHPHPQEAIRLAWTHPDLYKKHGGCLFSVVALDPDSVDLGLDDRCGCLTEIRSVAEGHEENHIERHAFDNDLEGRIAKDRRLPVGVRGITLDNLHVFAEYQREADALRNKILKTE